MRLRRSGLDQVEIALRAGQIHVIQPAVLAVGKQKRQPGQIHIAEVSVKVPSKNLPVGWQCLVVQSFDRRFHRWFRAGRVMRRLLRCRKVLHEYTQATATLLADGEAKKAVFP